MSKNRPTDYLSLKKALSPFFDFGFRAPRKGKEFSPQQKSAITRAFNKIAPYLDKNLKIKKDEVTFLKYPEGSKLPNIDGIRTHKGMIYKFGQASLSQLKDSKKWVVVVNPTKRDKKTQKIRQKQRDVFFPIPKKFMTDINLVKKYVDKLKEKYGPHNIMWSYKGKRERTVYDPELFDLYFSGAFDIDEDSNEFKQLDQVDKITTYKLKKFRKKYEEEPDYYNGVFFIYYI